MLKKFLERLPPDDARVVAECISILHPNEVKDIRHLSDARLALYNLIKEGATTSQELVAQSGLSPTNVYTQLKALKDLEYIQKEVYDGRPSTYRISTLEDVVQ